MLDTTQSQKDFKCRSGRILEAGEKFHSENKEVTKEKTQESGAKERAMVRKKTNKQTNKKKQPREFIFQQL